ncbi:MAG: glycosyltransferase family 9 protein [Bdellovibrionia bacterium]
MRFFDRLEDQPEVQGLRRNIGGTREERRLRGDGPLRILVIRPDRIGDVVLSTPVFELIKRHYPNAHLTALVQENVLPILRGLKSVEHFITFDPNGVHAGIKGFFRLVTEIRRRHFRIAIVLQTNWKVSAAIFFARVKYRIGPLSKLHSYLFFNRGKRQRRSHVEMHETDYNLQLLRKLGARISTRQIPTEIFIPESTLTRASGWLKQKGWDSDKALILVHPGMGGSALNWPESHYIELIRSLVEEGRQILVSGGPVENALLDRIETSLAEMPASEKTKVILYRSRPQNAPTGETVDFLAALCSFSQLVIAPSTGPLHIAVALRKPVITFYPPIRVQSAVRWGPYLEDESQASILVPEVYCGQERECRGKVCNYFPCMKSLTVKQTLDEAHFHLNRAEAAIDAKIKS